MLHPRKINFTRRRGNKQYVQLILNIAESNKRDKAKRAKSNVNPLYVRCLEAYFRDLYALPSLP